MPDNLSGSSEDPHPLPIVIISIELDSVTGGWSDSSDGPASVNLEALKAFLEKKTSCTVWMWGNSKFYFR